MSGERERLQRALGYEFNDAGLLELALTHRSCGAANNERLEFLGDSILNHIVAEFLFGNFPDCSEGELSRMRASLVKRDTLAGIARALGLGEAIRLGPGEMKSGGKRRNSILADTLEAVIGAMLLDSGQQTVRERVLGWFEDLPGDVSPELAAKDPKTALQEYLQGRGLPLPEYYVAEVQGEDHNQQFRIECRLSDPALVREGRGSSRRRAEQAAASAVLEVVNGSKK